MARPEIIIAHRYDLLGGRLIPLLNAMRLAEATGARFLTTWYSDASDIQRLIAPIEEIFTGWLVTPAAEGGALLPSDDPLLAEAGRGVTHLPPPVALRTFPESPVIFGEPQFTGRVWLDEQRYMLLRTRPDETYEQAAQGIAAIFPRLPKTAVVQAALERIDAWFARHPETVALHARRLHVQSNSELQVNRFDSYVHTSYYVALAEQVGAPMVYVASDSAAFVANVRARASARVIGLADILPDADGLTQLQRSLVELYALGRARELFGAASAFSLVAAQIGGAQLKNISAEAAARGLGGEDRTWAVAGHRATRDEPTRQRLIERLANGNPPACVYQRLIWIGTEGVEGRLRFAIKGLAVRLTEFVHSHLVADDWRGQWHLARDHAAQCNRADLLPWLDALHPLAPGPPADAPPASREEALLRLCARTMAADRAQADGDLAGAVGLARDALALADDLHVPAAGLRLRLAECLLRLGEVDEAMRMTLLATEIAPESGEAWCRLARLQSALGQFAAAQASAGRARDLEPEEPAPWLEVARAARGQGHDALCAEALRQAEACEPGNPPVLREIATLR